MVLFLLVAVQVPGIAAAQALGTPVENGHISGTVTDESGNPLAGIGVSASPADFGGLGGVAGTTADGRYDIGGLAAGNYKVYFFAGATGFVSEYYDDAASFDVADAVSVTAGATTPDIDAQLALGGGVMGRVTGVGGNALAIIAVRALRIDGNAQIEAGGTHTDSSGNYELSGLRAGQYRIEFYDYFSQTYARGFVAPVIVTTGTTTQNVDVQLVEGGHITGTVTDPSGNPLAGIQVNAQGVTAALGGHAATTTASGTYNIGGLDTGDYRVRFDGGATQFVSEYYNDASFSQDADPVAVTAGATTANINAELARGGIVQGRVTGPDGSALPYASVQAYRLEGNSRFWVGSTGTDLNGDYAISLSAGEYRLEFHHFQSTNPLARGVVEPVTVTAGVTLPNVDIQLVEGGHITGKVTDGSGQGLAGIQVNAFASDGGQGGNGATTAANGAYDIGGLDTGDYRVQFQGGATGYVTEYYNDASGPQDADAVPVTAGATTANINAQLAQGGIVKGRVTGLGGTALWQIGVNAYRLEGSSRVWAGSTGTDPNGDYALGLPAGQYRIEFDDSQSGQYARGVVEPVTVTAGLTTANVNIQLVKGGHITGTVTDASGNPLVGIQVSAMPSVGCCGSNAMTSATGTYDIGGLSTGNYKIQFSGGATGYVSEFYNDAPDYTHADTVAVTAGATTQNINAQLARGGTVTGRVTGLGGAAVAQISVNAYRLEGNSRIWTGSIGTDPNGNYALVLPAGQYRMEFDDWQARQYARGVVEPVTVTAGVTTANVNIQLVQGGRITGTVTDESGKPLAGFQVNAMPFDNSLSGNGAMTAANGTYDIGGLQAGNYRVQFYGGASFMSEFYNDTQSWDDAQPVSVTAGGTTPNINAQLAPGGSIGGIVTDGTGKPLANVGVLVLRWGGWQWWQVGWGNTNADPMHGAVGSYIVGGLPAGQYAVRFSDQSGQYAFECFNEAPDCGSPTLVQVQAGATTGNVNARLDIPAGRIAGRVTDAAGQGLSGVQVSALMPNGEGFAWISSSQTDAGGNYSVGGLATGTYRVQFNPMADYAREYYDDAVWADVGKGVAVVAGATTSGINAQLGLAGAIAGRVTGAGNAALPGIEVGAFQKIDGDWEDIEWGTTDASGNYRIEGLRGGTYRVVFSDAEGGVYAFEMYDNKIGWDVATPVTVTPGQTTTGINAQLAAGGAIAGRVTDTSNRNVKGIGVTASRQFGSEWEDVGEAETDASGNYRISGLPGGTYRIVFWHDDGAYAYVIYNQQASWENATAVQVTAGATTSNINAKISPAGHIKGRVTDSSGRGAAAISVESYRLFDGVWSDVGEAYTNPDGTYDIAGLAAGSYRVCFADPAGRLRAECHQDAPNVGSGTSVNVTAGQTVSGINAVLAAATAGDKDDQAITFGGAPTLVVGGTGTVAATGGASGNPVTFTSQTAGICITGGTNGSTVTGVAAGTCTIAANQTGNASYNAAPQVTKSFAVGKGSQTIAFDAAPSVAVGGSGTVAATGGASGNPVTFTSQTAGVCTTGGTNGSIVTGMAVGTCTIAANQAGNANYNAAAKVTQGFSVGKGAQVIALGTAPTVSAGATGTVTATGGKSGNPVTFASQTPGVCTTGGTNGSTVTGVAVGTCAIAANQAGNANYNAAATATQTFIVGKGTQVIVFNVTPSVQVGKTGKLIAVGGGSGNPVTFTSQTPNLCTTGDKDGSTLTAVVVGTCTIAANQAGNDSFYAAPEVTKSFAVGGLCDECLPSRGGWRAILR